MTTTSGPDLFYQVRFDEGQYTRTVTVHRQRSLGVLPRADTKPS